MKEKFILRVRHEPTRKALEAKAKKNFTSVNMIINKAIQLYLKEGKN